MSALSYILALFITLPLLGCFCVFWVSKRFIEPKRAARLSIDIGTFFLILLSEALMAYIWKGSFFWVVFLGVSIAALFYTIIYWNIKGDIDSGKLFKGIWRLNFLVFFVFDTVLIVYGLIGEIIKQT